jgi:hypothetical protein
MHLMDRVLLWSAASDQSPSDSADGSFNVRGFDTFGVGSPRCVSCVQERPAASEQSFCTGSIWGFVGSIPCSGWAMVQAMRSFRLSYSLPNQPVEPTGAPRRDFRAPGNSKVLGFGGRQARAPVAHFSRSIRMTRHASGWFDRLREACCGYAAEEATVAGALSGHAEEGPPMSRMIATAGPYRRSDLSAPISVIRRQKESGSNQPLEPTETSSCRGSIFTGAFRVSPCLRGSVHRSAKGFTRHRSAI